MAEAKWLVGGFSTAAGVLVEKSANSGSGGGQTRLRLMGYAIHQASSVANSTGVFTLRQGTSSNNILSSTPLAGDGGEFFAEVENLGLEAGYFAIVAPTTNAGGRVATIWGRNA